MFPKLYFTNPAVIQILGQICIILIEISILSWLIKFIAFTFIIIVKYCRATQRFNIDVEPLIEQLIERGREDGSGGGSIGMNAGK